jgi:hypothetical protein
MPAVPRLSRSRAVHAQHDRCVPRALPGACQGVRACTCALVRRGLPVIAAAGRRRCRICAGSTPRRRALCVRVRARAALVRACTRARARVSVRACVCVCARVRGTVVCANHRVRLARVGRAVRKQRVVVPEAKAEEKRRRCACPPEMRRSMPSALARRVSACTHAGTHARQGRAAHLCRA